MLEGLKAVRAARLANRLAASGRMVEAERWLAKARELFSRQPEGPERRRDLGLTYQVEAQIRMMQGSIEEGLQAYGMAEDLLGRDERSREHLGRCLYDAAVYLADLGLTSQADEYLERATTAFAGRTTAYEQDIRILRQSLAEHPTNVRKVSPEHVVRLRQLHSAHKKAKRAQYGYELARALLKLGAPDDFPEICRLLWDAAHYFRAKQDLKNYLIALSPITDVRDAPWPDWMDAATAEAVHVAEERGSLENLADAHFVRGCWLVGQGQNRQALGHALSALARYIDLSARMESSVVRLMRGNWGDGARELALQIAIENADADLAAELIEGARLQALPQESARASNYRSKSVIGEFANLSTSGISPVRSIAVRGHSRLMEYLPMADGVKPVNFEECIEAVGGPDALWWGVWAFNEIWYWCVIGGGMRVAGAIALREETQARTLMESVLNCSLASPSASPEDVVSGPLTRSYQAEESLSLQLGMLLVPDPLRRTLLANMSETGRPRSLVVSGNVFASLPLPLFGVETPHGDPYPARLVEVSVIRFAAPVALVDHVRSHPVYPADTYPVHVACVDSRGDLEHARRIPAGARNVLAGFTATSPSLDTNFLPATINNLRRVLQAVPPSDPSIFYYSGHASAGSFGPGIESGLVMADDVLTAEQLFTLVNGVPLAPFPARVLLGACQSSGAQGSGAGEWFGVAAAVLWAGARQVVATNWRVWDTPFVSWLDLKIVDAMRTSDDVSSSLRSIQLECLRRWRAEGRPSPAAAMPVLWGAYCCLGLNR
jgi:tetratricopeptide (TPR) repeat protein